MPPPKTKTAPVQEPSRYPAVEAFVEFATDEDVDHLFDSVREGLEGLKGPRAEQGKKVRNALASAEELFRHLLETRKKLEDSRGSKG